MLTSVRHRARHCVGVRQCYLLQHRHAAPTSGWCSRYFNFKLSQCRSLICRSICKSNQKQVCLTCGTNISPSDLCTSSFEIDGVVYKVLPNENNGEDTLHGGPDGWDWVRVADMFRCRSAYFEQRNWTVSAYRSNSITFSLHDADGNQGFPGAVSSVVTYTLSPNAWHFKMTAKALTKKTPIMLSSHVIESR